MQHPEYETTRYGPFSSLGRLSRSRFIRHNAIFFAGAAVMGGLNYLYYPVMGRLLRPDSFGEVQALFSLFAQIAIFLSVLGLLTVNIVANYDDSAKRNKVILELEKLAVMVSSLLLVGTVLSGTVLRDFFNFDSGAPFVLLALAVLISTPLTFRTAYLRGHQRFGLMSVSGILASAGNLALATTLVLAGFGTIGAISGLVLAQLLDFAFTARLAKKLGFSESLRRSFVRLPDLKLILPELKYAILVLIGSLVITGLYSIDTIVVKHYFDAHTAGLYAGISTIARIIFFLTASITQVLLPSIKLQQEPRKNRLVLFKSFLLLSVIGGVTLLVFSLAPHGIIRILMGETYFAYAGLLPRLSLVVFLISMLNLFIMYHMALRRYGIAGIVSCGAGLTAVLLAIHHQTLLAIINNLLYGSLGILGLLGIWIGYRKLISLQLMRGEQS